MPGSLRIQLLGDFRLWHDDVPVTEIDTPRGQSFLAYLLLHRGAPQSRSHLAFLFWPDSTESQARTNLRKQLYYLRRALPDADHYLHADTNVLYWKTDTAFSLDVAHLERALAEARAAEGSGDAEAQLDALQRAVALYQGDLLPNSYDDWLLDERQRLQQAFAGVLLVLASLLEGHRDYRAAAGHARRLLRLDPLHEPAYRQLMRLQALQGNRAAAIETYRTCTARLEEELGVAPSAATVKVYRQVMQQEAADLQPVASSAFASPLVGRHDEWARLQAAWREAGRGDRHLVHIDGPAGIGKTRLAEELLQWAGRQGIPTATARCYASEQDVAYGPLAGLLRSPALRPAVAALELPWLGELARLLPELLVEHPDLAPPRPMTESWQRRHLFEALSRPFDHHRQLVLLLDDLHWADSETLEWLPYLLHARGGTGRDSQLLVVATVRTGEMPGRPQLRAVLDELRHGGQLSRVDLGPLTEAESLALGRNVAGQALNPGLAGILFRETEGNPLFVVEMVRAAILDPGAKGAGFTPAAGRRDLPQAVQRAIAGRLARLSPAARDLAGVAAVIGRHFTVDVLAHAASPEEAAGDEGTLVGALDDLWQHDVICQQGPTTYDFDHDKIRQFIYDELSPARRRYLHGRVARALEAVHTGKLDPVSGQIAAHYERGGHQAEAAAYYRRAASVARRVYANEEAIGHYRRLLETDLSEALPRPDACAVMLDLGQVLQLTGRWDAADTVYRQALVQAERIDDTRLLARCRHALGDLVRLRGEYTRSLEWLSLARDGFEAASEERGLAQVLWTMGEVYWYRGDHERALAALERQMEIATRLGDLHLVADAAGTMGIIYWSRGDSDLARQFCEQSIDTARQIDHWWAVGRALITLGNVHDSQGQAEAAFACYEQALEVGNQIGDRQCCAWAVINMGNLYAGADDPTSALACYRYGLEVALDIGDRWSTSISLVDMAEMYALQGRQDRAERFYRSGTALARALDVNYLCEYLLSLAHFCARHGRPVEAQRLNDEARRLARDSGRRQTGGEDTVYRSRLLDVRLRHALGQLDTSAALAELERMLAGSDETAKRALAWYEIWRLAPEHRVDGQDAAGAYRDLPPAEVRGAVRHHYPQVTGAEPPPPPALPPLPQMVSPSPGDAEDLLGRADAILATLTSPTSNS